MGNGEKKRVLILTADAGFGHRSAANAVDMALKQKYGDLVETIVVNPLDDRRTPFFLRDSQADYDRLVRRVPELYKLGYDASDTIITSAIVESAFTVLLYEVMLDLVRETQPDVIITTYPMYLSPLEAIFIMFGRDIPLLTVVTDLATVHRMWFNKAVDACLVPNEIVRDLAINYGLSPEQVYITGIPVNPALNRREGRDKLSLRRALGWREDLTTVLAVGSRRVDRLLDSLNVLNHFGAPLQLAVVAGKDENLYAQLQEVEWHVPVHLYEFVTNMPDMLLAADCVMTKAGGLIVTESLAAGCPMMLIDVIPGQETGNAELVIRGGAGDLARSDLEVLEVMAHWMMDDRRLLQERAQNAAAMGRPQAAFEVADLAYQFALRGPVRHRHLFTRRTLIDLFNRNQVRWSRTGDLSTLSQSEDQSS